MHQQRTAWRLTCALLHMNPSSCRGWRDQADPAARLPWQVRGALLLPQGALGFMTFIKKVWVCEGAHRQCGWCCSHPPGLVVADSIVLQQRLGMRADAHWLCHPGRAAVSANTGFQTPRTSRLCAPLRSSRTATVPRSLRRSTARSSRRQPTPRSATWHGSSES